jgi:hypothetical protein
VARQLPLDDVVLVCAWPGLRGDGAVGRRRGRVAAEPRAHRRGGPIDLVRESEIGRACEHQWVATVLLEHWIGGGERRRRLSTVSRSSGGAPARCGARGREKQRKCKGVMARVSSWGAPGRALGPEEGTGAWKQLLASRRHAWRLGRRRRDVEEQGEASAGREAAAGVQERHVARREVARGQLELGTWPARAAGSGREKTERGGLEVDKGEPSCNFVKVQGLYCKA